MNKIKFLARNFFKTFYFATIVSVQSRRKGKDPEPDPYLGLTDPDADPGSQKYTTDPTNPEHCLGGYKKINN